MLILVTYQAIRCTIRGREVQTTNQRRFRGQIQQTETHHSLLSFLMTVSHSGAPGGAFLHPHSNRRVESARPILDARICYLPGQLLHNTGSEAQTTNQRRGRGQIEQTKTYHSLLPCLMTVSHSSAIGIVGDLLDVDLMEVERG